MSEQYKELFGKYGAPAFNDAYEHKDDSGFLVNMERALISGLAYVAAVQSRGDTHSLAISLKSINNSLLIAAMHEAQIIMFNNNRLADSAELLALLESNDIDGAKSRLESMIESGEGFAGAVPSGKPEAPGKRFVS